MCFNMRKLLSMRTHIWCTYMCVSKHPKTIFENLYDFASQRIKENISYRQYKLDVVKQYSKCPTVINDKLLSLLK